MSRSPISLAGVWQFRMPEDPRWRTLTVPGCWESLGIDKKHPGPALYRRTVDVPAEFTAQRIWLRFDGVSYHCRVRIDGREIARHTGAWDAFTVEITDAVVPGKAFELELEVEKPAGLTQGPNSPHLPGRFPLKQTLSGFLPYVWGHMFGGIWQDVWLYATGRTIIEDLEIRGDAAGRVTARAKLSGPSQWSLEVRDAQRLVVASASGRGEALDLALRVPNPHPWSPAQPYRYTAALAIDDAEQRTIAFGLRSQSVANDGNTILLNGRPLYPRMILSWGWYPEALHANPGPERVRADFQRLRSLGYNGVKLCLWVPPQYYFELADEMGMLLWLELPMWMPEPSDLFREQVFLEYPRLLKQVRHHPSIIIYTLGCELDRSIGPDILEPLFRLAREHAGDALVRDNSGSGEAYGGLLNEFAEYYDYHFYSDIHFFQPLLDYFSPRWRPPQPWVFGEFCDMDTFRDLRHVYVAHQDQKPWWTVADEQLNPQGARWQYDVVEQEQRLRHNGYWERGDELVALSHRQALLHRKWTLETVRAYREIGGYVITGEADTPVSTSGMWDDLAQLKFDPRAFAAFNDDLVILLGWDKRRAWIHGGDRAAYWDTWSYTAGQTLRAHVVLSNYTPSAGRPTLQWRLSGDKAELARGHVDSAPQIEPGTVRQVGLIEVALPAVEKPRALRLHADARLGDVEARNDWPLWLFPADAWRDVKDVALVDAVGRLGGLREMAPAVGASLNEAAVAIATGWSSELEAFLGRGGGAVVLLRGGETSTPVPLLAMPFWREAIRLIEPHPAWGDFPLDDGLAGLQFFGCATDHALDTSKLAQAGRPILRRLDARTFHVHDYATEIGWGRGRLILSTLRFEGGQGTQPLGLSRNTAAAYLLRCWVRYLQQG